MLFVIILCLGVLFQSSFGQVNQAEHDKLIKVSHFLEANPLDKDAKNMRAWAFTWAADTKDVTVIICGLAGPFMDKKLKFGSEMLPQYAIAMTAFKLEHPDQAADENAAQLAGVESAIKVYEIMVKEKPKNKNDVVEGLIAKRNKGELAAYVAAADCGKK